MLLKRFKYVWIFLLLLQTSSVFSQSDDLQTKLNTLRKENDLGNWIYEQLDHANTQPEKASALLQKAQKTSWRVSKTDDEHFAWLNLITTLGYYQLLDGNILASINTYENALSFFRTHQILGYDIVEYTFKPLSNNYTRLGDYERALYIQKESINFQRKYDEDVSKVAAIYCNMAISYRSMDRIVNAHQAIQDGFKSKPDAATKVMLNNVYADVLYDEGKYQKAATIIENNIKKQNATNAESAYWLMSSYTTAGNIYLELKQANKANRSFLQALSLLTKYYPSSRIREKANLYTQIGNTYLVQNQAQKAINYANKTLSTLGVSNSKNQIINKNIYGDNKLVEVFLLLAEAHLNLKKPENALTNINLSLLAADKIRSEFAGDKTKERLQAYLKKIAEKGISISYQLYQQTKNEKFLHQILSLMEQSKGRTLLDQIQRNQRFAIKNLKKDSLFIKKEIIERAISFNERQLLEGGNNTTGNIEALKFDLALINKSISKKYQLINREIASQPINLEDLANHHFIEYFIGEDDIYAIKINKRKIVDVVKLPRANDAKTMVSHFVQTYFQNEPNAMMNNPNDFFKASHQIFKLILSPLNIKSNEKLTIIPDGVLGYLSFEGLIADSSYTENISNWPFLIKRNPISYAFSLKTLQAKRKETVAENFAGLFITHQKGNKTPLKAIETEAKLIKANVAGDFLFNENVNSTSFSEMFGRTKVMHIGTHAYLSGKNSEPTLDFGKEKMYLFELSTKENAPSLVVLSACRTADGLLANGEGISSLSRGFNAIGTSATIASLWNVNDDAAANITASFYQILRNTKNASEALRAAKLEWLHTSKTSNALLLPYYWDSLVYIGKDQELELRKPTNWILYSLILGIPLLGVAIYIVGRNKLRKA